MDKQWHAMDNERVLEALDVRVQGLDAADMEERLGRYGRNEIESENGVSKGELLWAQVKNPLVAVLVGAAVISLISGHIIDAVVIAVIIVINTLIGFFQEYRAEQALEALKKRAAPRAKVLRYDQGLGQSRQVEIDAALVVPGDILVLEVGDKVPADGRILEAINLTIDESMLTGESVAVEKQSDATAEDATVADRTNMVFGGTIVTRGRGRAVITATGDETELGKIATLIRETDKVPSPLQLQTLDLGKKLGMLAVAVSALTFVIGLLKGVALGDIFFLALASAVSSIPEGLPAVMTITLAVGVNRMAKRNAIIRRLRAVDTLGAATVICTDKTGTLTTNEMTVQRLCIGRQTVEVSGVGFAPEGELTLNGSPITPQDSEALSLVLRIGALCNDAKLIQDPDSEGHWQIQGDRTEGALLVAAAKAGFQQEELAAEYPRVDEIPFDSKQKYMVTFHKRPDGRILTCVKGAPEVVMGMCSRSLNGEAQVVELDAEQALEANEQMALSGLRVLALAYQVIDENEIKAFEKKLAADQPLVFASLTGMMDPPRPEVAEAVRRCVRAGIKVIMATGDHQLTAKAIAEQVGILDRKGLVLNGSALDDKSDDEMDAMIEDVVVLARLSPEHKHRVVESLRRRGHVVAMTGDGVNDAPALQASDIGVAMGIAGTDVAKETSDMVLTDDNFASIVSAVEEGRAVFQNVRKVVKFLLATNIGEDLTIISALLIFPAGKMIITPLQILWVNLVTDGLLDITIALEPKEQDVMEDPPRHRDERIINKEILINMIYVAMFMAVGTILTFIWRNSGRGDIYARTVAFNTLAMFQVFNALNCRSRSKSVFQLGLFSNKYLLGAMGLSIVLQVAANNLPFMRVVLGTEPLALSDWLIIVAVSSSVFVADEIRKYIVRRRQTA